MRCSICGRPFKSKWNHASYCPSTVVGLPLLKETLSVSIDWDE